MKVMRAFSLVSAVSVVMLLGVARAQVTVDLPAGAPPMLEFASGEISQGAERFEGRLHVKVARGEGDPESYRLEVDGDTVSVTSPDHRGQMYGLLEVAEQLLISGHVQAKSERPFLRYRMLKFNPPLPGNVYLSEEDAAHGQWFFDLEYWKRFFAMMGKARYNVVSFWHSHPFGNAVRLEKYPEAAVLKGEAMDRAIAFWHALYELAHRHGIDVYWVTWNIHVTPEFAAAHGIKDSNVDSPLVRDYMRECVREMLREYPEIDGFGTCPSEAMGGMTHEQREDFIRECYLEPIRETGRPMPLVHRYWGGDPDAVAGMLERARYPGDVLLDIKFNGEHMYSSAQPHVQDRRWLEREARPYEILWHLRNDDIYQLVWGGPKFAADLIRSCGGAAGFVMGSEVEIPGVDRAHSEGSAWHKTWTYTFEKHWFRWMLWGRMGYNPEMGEDVWSGRYCSLYGTEVGAKVYEAVRLASEIIPAVSAFHWNYMNGDWYPEGNIGGWNTSAEMPRRNWRSGRMWHGIESWIFNNTIDAGLRSIPETVARLAVAQRGRSARPGGRQRGEAVERVQDALDVSEKVGHLADRVERLVQEIEWSAVGPRAMSREAILMGDGIEGLDCDLMDLGALSLLGRFYALQMRAASLHALVLLGVSGVNDAAGGAAAATKAAREAAATWAALAALADAHYVPHEVWLMGTFSWGMYSEAVSQDIAAMEKAVPIPRQERSWIVNGSPVRTVRWAAPGDPVKNEWIDFMNGIAGVVRVDRAAEATTEIEVRNGRSARVTFVGEGLVKATLPGALTLTPEERTAIVPESGTATLQLDPETSGRGFSLDVLPAPLASDVIAVPASRGTLRSPFVLVEDKTSLHGQCIDVPKGVGHGKQGASGPIIDNGWADYVFDAALATSYELWARVVFKDPDSNSLFVTIAGQGPWILADDVWNRWHWVRLPHALPLAEGAHSLRVRNREDGVRLDEIRLIPVGLESRQHLPLSFVEKLEIMGKEAVDQEMAAYFRRMTPVRPPRHTQSRESWENNRASVREVVLRDIGLDRLPEGVPLDPHIVATLKRDGYTLQRLYFQLFPGCYGSGWLYLPERIVGRAPAVLNPHGHWAQRAYDPVPQARMIGLAKKGYIALMTDNIHAGDLETGMTPIGLMTWQNMRALDYLCQRPDVDPERLGITGASGGGQQTMYMMAIDHRLKVAVPAVMASYFERILSPDSWHCWCNHAPGIASDTDGIEFLSLFAPKPVLFLCSSQDWTAKFPGDELLEVRKVWALYGKEGLVECVASDAPHGYEKERREAMYRFMNAQLGVSDPDEGREGEITPEPLEVLREMDKPLPGLRDWAKAVAWYRAQHVRSVPPEEIAPRLAELVRSVAPARGELGAVGSGSLEYHGGIAGRLLVRSEQGLELPALFLKSAAARDRAPVVVLLLPEGKRGAFDEAGELRPLPEALLAAGMHVLAIDARLTGELDRNWERNCLIWGRPEAGMAADDARWAARYLTGRDDVDRDRLAVVGVARMGVSALLAAVLDDVFSACVFDSMGRSYATHPLHDEGGYYSGAKWLRELGLPAIPHILRVADLPQAAAACKSPVAVIDAGSVAYPGLTCLAPGDPAGVVRCLEEAWGR
ncbi:MAG: hypothetical protein AB1486_03460 [Planctomycetota bacterium]